MGSRAVGTRANRIREQLEGVFFFGIASSWNATFRIREQLKHALRGPANGWSVSNPDSQAVGARASRVREHLERALFGDTNRCGTRGARNRDLLERVVFGVANSWSS